MDGGSTTFLFVLLLTLILGGGYFAATEIAFASANVIRLRTRAEGGDSRAKNAVYISEHFDQALTTLLIGNNIMHIGSASLATLLAKRLWGLGAVTWSTIVLTVVVFFVSEMTPKRFARSHAEAFALAVAGSLRFLMKLLKPVAAVFSAISEALGRLLGGKSAPTVTEEELSELLSSAGDRTELTEEEGRLLSSAMAFDRKTAGQVMTPLAQVVTLSADTPPAQAVAFARAQRHSRIPVWRGKPERIIGVLYLRDLLKAWLREGEALKLTALLQKPVWLGADAPIDEALRAMNDKHVHLALVRDARDAVAGVVTAEDILEELVGEIYDEEDLPLEGRECL